MQQPPINYYVREVINDEVVYTLLNDDSVLHTGSTYFFKNEGYSVYLELSVADFEDGWTVSQVKLRTAQDYKIGYLTASYYLRTLVNGSFIYTLLNDLSILHSGSVYTVKYTGSNEHKILKRKILTLRMVGLFHRLKRL